MRGAIGTVASGSTIRDHNLSDTVAENDVDDSDGEENEAKDKKKENHWERSEKRLPRTKSLLLECWT